jgi:hypothetical protein
MITFMVEDNLKYFLISIKFFDFLSLAREKLKIVFKRKTKILFFLRIPHSSDSILKDWTRILAKGQQLSMSKNGNLLLIAKKQ